MALDYSVILNQPSAGEQIQQGIGQFLGIREAEAQAAIREAQMQQAERQAAFGQAFGQAFQTGDRNQIMALMGQFPEQYDQIKGALGFQDEQRANTLGTLGIQLGQLAQTSPQAAAQFIAQNADVLRQAGPGYEPEQLIASLQQDPAAFAKRAEMIGAVALGAEKYFDITGERAKLEAQLAGQDIERDKLVVQQQEGAANRAARLQAAQIRASATLADAAAKLQAGQQLGAKDLRQINSDLTTFTKDHAGMYSAAKDLETLKARNTPASQLAAIFKYMKALDPTSVVREGEQVMVQRTDGVFGTMANYVSQLQSGQRLNPKQMEDLEFTAKGLADSQAGTVNQTIDEYLSAYGDTIPASQKKLLEARKPKLFGQAQAQKAQPASEPGGWEIVE